MADLSSAQVNQSRILLRSLQRASDKLADSLKDPTNLDRSVVQERRYAIDALVQARLRIEHSKKNLYDLKARYLLLHFGSAETSQIRNVLETFLPKEPTLVEFGHVPWFEIEAAFAAAQTRCPLALQKFHAEFQEEIHVGSNLSDILPKLSGKPPRL